MLSRIARSPRAGAGRGLAFGLVSILAGVLLLGVLGIASAEPSGPSDPDRDLERAASATVSRAAEPTFATIEEAARAAFAQLRSSARRSADARLRIGSIVRVDGAYTWREATQPVGARYADWRPRARLALGSESVATFVVHVRTGESALDRANEQFTSGERRIVDELDPLHRPMFLLTPSGRIVHYAHETEVDRSSDFVRTRDRARARGRELADLRRPDATTPAVQSELAGR